jgi:glycosyltransferase involved in cell wall biosynthesis
MKQVLVDMHRLKYHPYNGLYRFSIELGAALSQLQPHDMDLHYYLPKKDFGIFGTKARYEEHKSIDKFYKWGTGRFDVWHATTTLSWYRPFNRKTRFVFTVHDLNFLEEAERSGRHKDRYFRLISKRLQRADFITYISEYSRQETERYLDVKGKPGTVIYNGCNVPTETNFKTPSYIPSKPFLFSIGLFMSRKNFHVLPQLLSGTDYELVIAGLNDFPYRDHVLEAAKSAGVSGRVHLVGPVDESSKYWYYRHCEAFLFPSLGEGFGLPVIEAMWFGKPVFLSKSTCLPEIGGKEAYYFDDFTPETMRKNFNDGMQHYSRHAPQDAIRKRAETFSWKNAAKQYADVYRQLA